MMMMTTTVMLAALGAAPTSPAWAAGGGYRTRVGEGSAALPLVVVKGTPYEMGLAQGRLMKEEVRATLPRFLHYAQASGDPRFADAALDQAWATSAPYTDKRMIAMMHGVADGSGLGWDAVRRAHAIPLVASYSCSGVAAWGKATKDGHLLQIRNLDYYMGSGLQDHPLLVVYLPDQGIAHIEATFAGAVGCQTGMNAEGIALTLIGDSPNRESPFDVKGEHFFSIFRAILFDAHNLDQALAILKKSQRIKKYHYVIGDGKIPAAVKIRAHAPELRIWKDDDPQDELAPDIFKNLVCHAETRTPTALAHIRLNYGAYDSDRMMQLARAIGMAGKNLLSVVYDASALELWVAYAQKEASAYRQPFVHVRMKDYLDFSKRPAGAVVFESQATPTSH